MTLLEHTQKTEEYFIARDGTHPGWTWGVRLEEYQRGVLPPHIGVAPAPHQGFTIEVHTRELLGGIPGHTVIFTPGGEPIADLLIDDGSLFPTAPYDPLHRAVTEFYDLVRPPTSP